jgi:protein disulfide-isomerase A1
MSHMLKQVLEPIFEVDEQRFHTVKALDLPLLMLTRDPDDEPSFEVLRSLARKELSDRFLVGVTSDATLAGVAGTTPPFLAVFNVLDETIPKYEGPIERNAVLEFANKVSSPLIRQLDLAGLAAFMKVVSLCSRGAGTDRVTDFRTRPVSL